MTDLSHCEGRSADVSFMSHDKTRVLRFTYQMKSNASFSSDIADKELLLLLFHT